MHLEKIAVADNPRLTVAALELHPDSGALLLVLFENVVDRAVHRLLGFLRQPPPPRTPVEVLAAEALPE